MNYLIYFYKEFWQNIIKIIFLDIMTFNAYVIKTLVIAMAAIIEFF